MSVRILAAWLNLRHGHLDDPAAVCLGVGLVLAAWIVLAVAWHCVKGAVRWFAGWARRWNDAVAFEAHKAAAKKREPLPKRIPGELLDDREREIAYLQRLVDLPGPDREPTYPGGYQPQPRWREWSRRIPGTSRLLDRRTQR